MSQIEDKQNLNPSKDLDRTTLVMDPVDEKQTEVVEDRTTVVNDDRATEVADNRATEVYDKASITPDHTNKRMKVDVGDIIGNQFKIGELLTDASGEAEIHYCSKDGVTYVAKIYKRSYEVNQALVSRIEKIDSPYIMKNIESGYHNERYYEIMPYFKQGTLFDNLTTLDIDFIKNTVVSEVNEGLKAIHDHDMSHNDIKPHNIFLTDDKKHIVIGDFGILKDLNGRTYVTKTGVAMTLMYAAPEADESTSKMVDYFALGMTLLHIGFRKDPFVGLTNKKIRMLLLNYAQKIPDEIDSQLADLIAKLIKHAPYERLDYEGVKAWVNNKNIYFNARKESSSSTQKTDNLINIYRFKASGVEMKLNNIEEITEAFNDHWSDALKHYDNFLLPEAIKASNAELFIELKEMFEKYKKNHDLGLFFMLHKLNPALDFTYRGIAYGDFAGFINQLMKDYPVYDADLIDYEVLQTIIEGHGLHTKSPEILVKLKQIFRLYMKKDVLVEAIINTFKPVETMYINGARYTDLIEFSSKLFDKEGTPIVIPLEASLTYFYHMALTPYKIDENVINTIINEKDIFTRYCSLSHTLTNKFSILAKEGKITSFYDFVQLAKSAYLGRKEKLTQYLNQFMVLKRHHVIHKIEGEKSKELVELCDAQTDIQSKLACLYFYTDKKAKYINEIGNLQDLINRLATIPKEDLLNASEYFLADPIFRLWLISKGYTNESIEKLLTAFDKDRVII